jgi:hypothetical protein
LVEEKLNGLEFTYGWPAEVEAIRTLKTRFEKDLETQRKQALAIAREDLAARGPDAPYDSHGFSQVWEAQGSNPLLLSLVSEIGTFTGGVHGNASYVSLLWYKSADREIKVADLFGDSKAAYKAMTLVYCAELRSQQAEKRAESPPLPGSETAAECEPLDKQVIVPVDENKDGKFELLRVMIGPYGAGPYVEGSYSIDIPVTAGVRALLKPEFVSAF